jgi:hypothetical protein
MRRVTTLLSAVAVVLMAAAVAAQAKPSFAGEWTRDVQLGDGVRPQVDLAITQDAATMTIEYGSGGQAPAPRKLTYKLDGSVSKNMVAGRGGSAPTEQVSKAMWVGNSIVVTTATGAGEEKRTFSMDGGNLVVDTSAPTRSGAVPSATMVTYKRYVRGYGG